jgi:imidazolonepropionase-like amidohydrolase
MAISRRHTLTRVPTATAPERAPRLLLQGGRVLDPLTGAAPREDLLIQGGRIVEVGPGLDGDRAFDVADLTLVPGVIDCHVHALFNTLDAWSLATTPLSYRLFAAAKNMERTLIAGVTTVRDAAGIDAGFARACEEGLFPGPAIVPAISMISQTGGHGDPWVGSDQLVETLLPHFAGVPRAVVDGPDAMRQVVRQLWRAGAGVLKVATSGGVLSTGSVSDRSHFSPAELEALNEEAHALGLPIMAHAHGAAAVKAAIAAGVASVEHGLILDERAVASMVEHDVTLVPTLGALDAVIDAAQAGVSLPPNALELAQELRTHHYASVRLAHDAGVRIALGTDAGIVPHGSNLQEIGRMVSAGLSPLEAVRAATVAGARLLGLSDDRGRLEPGLRADIVGIAGDPLDPATYVDDVRVVIKHGVPVVGIPFLEESPPAELVR